MPSSHPQGLLPLLLSISHRAFFFSSTILSNVILSSLSFSASNPRCLHIIQACILTTSDYWPGWYFTRSPDEERTPKIDHVPHWSLLHSAGHANLPTPSPSMQTPQPQRNQIPRSRSLIGENRRASEGECCHTRKLNWTAKSPSLIRCSWSMTARRCGNTSGLRWRSMLVAMFSGRRIPRGSWASRASKRIFLLTRRYVWLVFGTIETLLYHCITRSWRETWSIMNRVAALYSVNQCPRQASFPLCPSVYSLTIPISVLLTAPLPRKPISCISSLYAHCCCPASCPMRNWSFYQGAFLRVLESCRDAMSWGWGFLSAFLCRVFFNTVWCFRLCVSSVGFAASNIPLFVVVLGFCVSILFKDIVSQRY